MWPFSIRASNNKHHRMILSDTLGGKRDFSPRGNAPVTMYSCGPTVYGPQHIGNLRAAVFSDTLARTLKAAGYRVERVINITDVGHLVGDGDEGEDKMSVGAKRDGTTPEEIAEKYTKRYLEDIRELNIDTDDIRFPRATEYITEQIEMIRTLEKKGLAYRTPDGVYFDTQKFPDYGQLGNVRAVSLQAGKRVAVKEKRSEHDFVLWRAAKPLDLQQWDSPWGRGNPGWSIECSAMATKLLGSTIDIHTGGQDHIQVHHNNEIAQSEGATGKKPFARYWLHNAFLTIGGEKISKSLGNTYTLDDVEARDIHPLALRYLFLQAHYRTPLSFTWESLASALVGLNVLWSKAASAKQKSGGRGRKSARVESVLTEIKNSLFDDLNTAYGIALLFSTTELSVDEEWYLFEEVEKLFGLSLPHNPHMTPLPKEIVELGQKRTAARMAKDFKESDRLRETIENRGYRVDDGPSGTTYTKIK